MTMHDEQLAYIEKLNDEQELSVEDVRALIAEVKRLRHAAPINYDPEIMQERRDEAALRVMTERFFVRWGPNHTIQLRAEFQTDFNDVVRRIYVAAQAPYVKAMCAAVARQPMQPFFVTKDAQK